MAGEKWVPIDDPNLKQELRDLGGGDVSVFRLVGSDDTVATTTNKVIPTVFAPPAAANAASSDSRPPVAPCCDAYPAETLTKALGTEVDPKVLWEAVDPNKQQELAESITQKAAEARLDLLEKSAWAAAPEMVLLEACDLADRHALSKQILEIRTSATPDDYARRAAEAGLAAERTAIAAVARETLVEAKHQMEMWTNFASLGKRMLKIASGFSAVMILAVIVLAALGDLGETEAPIIIFVLAIFAVSPAVLLLRERPLEGLDKFTPSGPVKEEAPSGGSGDSSSGPGGTATLT